MKVKNTSKAKEDLYLGFKGIDSNNAKVIDCYLETPPSDWQSISSSISDFFSNLIKNEGNKFWLKQ